MYRHLIVRTLITVIKLVNKLNYLLNLDINGVKLIHSWKVYAGNLTYLWIGPPPYFFRRNFNEITRKNKGGGQTGSV